MDSCNVSEGIAIGAFGGAAASLVIIVLQTIKVCVVEHVHKTRIYEWILNNTTDDDGGRYRSSRSIASHNNLTEDRVRYICSHHKQIYLSTGGREDMWGVHGISGRKIS